MLTCKKYIFTILLFWVCTPTIAEDKIFLVDLVSHNEAIELLAKSIDESCDICVEQILKKAFNLLDRDLKPGKTIVTSAACLFEKNVSTGVNELTASCYSGNTGSTPYPILTFRFHTPAEKLAGISAADLTKKQNTSEYRSNTGELFEGILQIIEFRYGDGQTFHYLRNAHHLQVHCKLMDLNQVIVLD